MRNKENESKGVKTQLEKIRNQSKTLLDQGPPTTVKKMENTHALVAKQRMSLKSRLGVDWFADQTDATLGESKCGNKNSRFSILDRRRRRSESRV
jgi:hypothetical protein